VALLALCILWLASQSMAADYSADTLRNTLLRPVRRVHVLCGKFLALATTACVGWAAVAASIVSASALAFGFRDLEDVSKHGDRQVLADARDVAPVMLDALGNLLLPVVATAAVGLMVSTLSKRPARALMLSLALLLGLEAVRGHMRPATGLLLSSHLPVGLRDDSVVGYFASIARGAADANWQFADLAVATPLGWIALALLASGFALSRLRIS
jgi:ABC-type transport system involved in multi-copper enzyme maturation permease subunit